MLLYINKPWDTEFNVALNTRLYCRDDSRFAPSQWETPLLCNNVSHWLGASLESGLILWLCWYAITNPHANPCVLYLQPWDLASGHNLQLEPVITATSIQSSPCNMPSTATDTNYDLHLWVRSETNMYSTKFKDVDWNIIIRSILCHSSEGNSIGNVHESNHYNTFGIYTFKIKATSN